ncbi:MAG: hypothetical protein VYE68_10250, partial [Acidobacteriota bacterium]|nr:hypothetical protein [Acidobacteriota bacterium]
MRDRTGRRDHPRLCCSPTQYGAVVVGSAILIICSVNLAGAGGQTGTPVATPGLLVVSRFVNVSGDPADDWIGQGIADTLATDLGPVLDADRMGNLRVRGAYQRVAGHLRVTAQLVDRETGRSLAAVRVDGTLTGLFALQDELSARLRAVLGESTTNYAPSPMRRYSGRGAGPEPWFPAPASGPPRHNVTEPAATSGAPLSPRPGEPAEATDLRPGTTSGRVGPAIPPLAAIEGPAPPRPPNVVSRDDQGRVTMRAIRLDGPLQLDGQLDERVYFDVEPVADF